MRTFVPIPENCDFPIENLPFGVFSTAENENHRIGVAIGNWIVGKFLKYVCCSKY